MFKACLFVVCAFLHSLGCIAQSTVTDRKFQNLQAFARLYGYVRYFHPSDEAASVDWDKFAIYGSNRVLTATTDRELLITLQELFNPVAPAVLIYLANKKQKFNITTITPPDKRAFTTIAWQHYGVGLGNSNVYKSVRINRPGIAQKTKSSFAPINQLLDAQTYAGKQVKVKAWMKVEQEGGEGAGQLWLRVDKEKGLGFFYNMDDRPATANEWKQYEFDATIDKDGKNIYFGAFLAGRGKLLIDHFELLVKDENQWKPVFIKNGSFEEIQNNTPEGWSLGKLPLYDYSTNNTDVKNGKHALQISSKASPGDQRDTRLSKPIFDRYPKPGEIVKKTLNDAIEAIIPLALYGTETFTFPETDKARFRILSEAIQNDTKDKKDATDLSVRLADVMIAWNIFKHFFSYWDNASKTQEVIFRNAISKAFTDRSSLDFLQTLQLMTAPLNDGHIWVSLKGNSRNYTLPLLVGMAEGKLVIEKTLDSALLGTLEKGDVITSVDGVNAEEFVRNTEKYFSGSPQWKQSRSRSELFNGIENSTVEVVIERNGKTSKHELRRNTSTSSLYAAMGERQKSGFIKPGIYYIDLDKQPFDSIKNHLTDFKTAKAIICDLRGYPNNNHQFISYLLKEKENTKWMFIPEIIYPDYEKVNYAGLGWNMSPAKESFDARVIFIIDGRAISYAESYMGFIKDFKLATIVGQPTAGTNGNVNPFTLPGGYNMSWTGMLVKNHDGSRHHLRGIVPDVYVERTVKGITEGRDEFLEKAIELAEK
jgi:hypothetical protein